MEVRVAQGVVFDSLPRLVYVNALFIIGTLGTLVTPAMLEGWAPLHWTPLRLGMVAAFELGGVAVGSLSGLYWQRRWNWRAVALWSLLVALAANLACVIVRDFAAVCVLRGVVGLSGGLLSALYSAVLANSRSPGRIIAVTTFLQIAVEAAIMFCAASMLERVGATGLFVLMAGLFGVLLPFLHFLAPRWPSGAARASCEEAVSTSRRAYPLLLAFIPLVVVQTGVFAFLGEFGHLAAHLSGEDSLNAIGISVIVSAVGSVAAYLLDDRLGLRLPIVAGIVLMTGTLCGMILAARSAGLFLFYISFLQIGWVFLNCYLYSALIDADNLLVPAATPVATFGSAVGASAMGYVLDRHGVAGSLVMTVGCMVLTAFLTLPFLQARTRLSAPDSRSVEAT